MRDFNLVAGPGIAPGLEDYALVNLVLPRVSDYIISPKLGILACSLYGLSPLKNSGGCLGIFLR